MSLLLLLTGAVYFWLKFVTPLIGPALLAMLFVTIFGPLLQKMQSRLHLHRQIGALLLLLLAMLLLLGLVWILFSWIVGSLPGWVSSLDAAKGEMQSWIHRGFETMGQLAGVDTLYLENIIWGSVEVGWNALGGHSVLGMLSQSFAYANKLAAWGGFLVTFAIAAVLLAKDYDDIMNKLMDREECHVLLEVICGVIRYIATYVKAQIIIMTCIGFTAAVSLGLARISNGVLWGILAGVLDAFPFIGTGVVLVPLGIVQIVQGRYGTAVVCGLLYVACIFLREMLEPRLIGRRMGVRPIAVLLSLYVGIRLFGVWGIVKGPLGFVVIRQSYLSILRKH